MKSKIRSRWYRANEKPLESNSSGASAEAPFGEIDPTKGKALEDDLSKAKPPQSTRDGGNRRRREDREEGIAEVPETVENPEAAEINEIAETHATETNKATTGAREKTADPEKTKGTKTAEATDPGKDAKTGMETIPIGKRDRGTEIGKTKANGKGVITDPVKTNEATIPKEGSPLKVRRWRFPVQALWEIGLPDLAKTFFQNCLGSI